jgi:hypothetical protein
VLILPAGMSGDSKYLAVENKVGRGVFSLQSADGKPLERAERILFLHLTNTAATGMSFDDKEFKMCTSYGSAPHLAERGEAEVRIKLEGEFKLYSCDTAGKRLAEIPLQRNAEGSLQFQASVFRNEGSVFVYELVRQKN